MSNKDFYDAIFPDFWKNIDKTKLETDDHSMFGDEPIFDWLIKSIRPAEIIEIGSWKGHSANWMADRCMSLGLNTRVLCVDSFLGGPEHWLLPGAIETMKRHNGQPRILDAFLGNTIARGNEDRIFPLTLDASSAETVLAHFDFRADLVFVDAGHDYDDVVADITGYYKRLSIHGVMFGDDYQHEPVARAVHDCAVQLGVQVVVWKRKWAYVNEALLRAVGLPEFQVRTGFEGWVHP